MRPDYDPDDPDWQAERNSGIALVVVAVAFAAVLILANLGVL